LSKRFETLALAISLVYANIMETEIPPRIEKSDISPASVLATGHGIIEPLAPHTYTAILLHGLGSNGRAFWIFLSQSIRHVHCYRPPIFKNTQCPLPVHEMDVSQHVPEKKKRAPMV
jgi:hypothetical protein